MLAGWLGSALLMVAPVDDSYGQTRIGRLFSTQEQRIELDRLRNESGFGEDAEPVIDRTGSEPRAEPERAPPAVTVTFNGVVIRSDGHRLAWIDGVETATGATTPAGVRIEADRTPDGRLRIGWSDGRTSVVLEPGQSVDSNGTVRNGYERRSTGVAAGIPGEPATDSSGAEEGGGTTAPVGSPEPALPPALPANLVQELPQGTRAASAPLDEAASGARPAGDGQRMATYSTGRESGQ